MDVGSKKDRDAVIKQRVRGLGSDKEVIRQERKERIEEEESE